MNIEQIENDKQILEYIMMAVEFEDLKLWAKDVVKQIINDIKDRKMNSQ